MIKTIAPETITSVTVHSNSPNYIEYKSKKFKEWKFMGFSRPFIEARYWTGFELYDPGSGLEGKWRKFTVDEAFEMIKKEYEDYVNYKVIKESDDLIRIEEFYRLKISYNQGGKYTGKTSEWFETQEEVLAYYNELKVLLRPFLELSDINGIKKPKMTK